MEEIIQQDSMKTNVQQLMLNGQSKFEDNIESLMKLIKEKENELKKAEQELKQKSDELEEKEKQLEQLDAEMKEFRKVSYIILIFGLILIITGLGLILFRRSSKFKSANYATSKIRMKKDRKQSESE